MSIQELPQVLPCGCKVAKRIVDGERQNVYQPCSKTCQFFLYAIAETRKQGKPVREQQGRFGIDGRVKS